MCSIVNIKSVIIIKMKALALCFGVAFAQAFPVLPLQDYIIYCCVCVFLVLFGGLMSGLTVGLLSLDDLVLEMKLKSGSDEEKKQAERVLPVIQQHHLLLVTLLLANAAAMEALPVFLDVMVPEYLAIVLSVTFVLFFGEVIPNALCTGPDQLKIAARLIPTVKFLMCCLWPISYPIAKLLDHCLGVQFKTRYKNNDLKTLLDLHVNSIVEAENSKEDEGGLVPGQIKMIHGAIDMKGEVVKTHMINIAKVYSVDSKCILDYQKMQEIMKKGYSRIPVYRGKDINNLIGLVLAKSIININPNEDRRLSETGVKFRKPLVCKPDMLILDLLMVFKDGSSHMAFVTDEPDQLQHALDTDTDLPFGCKIVGIITIEDILEQLLKGDIFDEDDFDNVKDNVMKNLFSAYTSKDQRPLTINPMKANLLLAAFTGRATTKQEMSPVSDHYQRLRDDDK